VQSARIGHYKKGLESLIANGTVYSSPHSRTGIRKREPGLSPVDGDQIFPPDLRQGPMKPGSHPEQESNIRFRVPDGRMVEFKDNRTGLHRFEAGKDFGDFIVWKKDGWPSYELAVVVDDHAMKISEVVRGEDLLVATARQILLYEALGWQPPEWYHCALVEDPETGYRMSKTRQSLSLKYLREKGLPPGKPPAFYF
jgi:glutamyl-tRNA synthetase